MDSDQWSVVRCPALSKCRAPCPKYRRRPACNASPPSYRRRPACTGVTLLRHSTPHLTNPSSPHHPPSSPHHQPVIPACGWRGSTKHPIRFLSLRHPIDHHPASDNWSPAPGVDPFPCPNFSLKRHRISRALPHPASTVTHSCPPTSHKPLPQGPVSGVDQPSTCKTWGLGFWEPAGLPEYGPRPALGRTPLGEK